MLPERTDALVGSMLGKDYRVLKPIGAGGMAVVYLVEHQTLLKQFAAKVLSRELASSLEARARFTQEAHAASQLDHENIVSISDFGVTVDQRPYFVMELLRGQTLDQRLAEGPMTIEEVVAVSVPVARALAHAHAEGIVHLDVKPENIFLVQRSQGRWGVKVVDFGIAKTPLNPRLAKTGETVGSPMFMAPEMCRGDDDIDQRADVYSFGILLYLMMCGRLPFVDDSLQRVLQMQLVQLPPPPREINSELSPELAVIVERALAKHPGDRHPSMEAFLHDLEAALPIGSDRLLIEAQSGTTLRDTPFAGTLSMARHDSNRTSRASQPPIPSSSSPNLLPSSPLNVLPSSAMSWSSPGARSSSRPPAPQSRRVPIVVATAIASTLIGGVLIWRQIATAPMAESATSAMATLPAKPPVDVAAPHAEVAAAVPRTDFPPAPPPPVPAASDDRVVAPAAAGDRDPAPVGVAEADHTAPEPVVESPKAGRTVAIGKKPFVRAKLVTRHEPLRPEKRVATIASAGTSTSRLATSTGSPPAASSPGDAESGAKTAPPAPDGGRAAPPPAGGEHEATAGAPPIPPPSAKPAAPAAPAAPGALDATPSVVSLDVKGSLSPSTVRRSVERTLSSLRACYRTAARAGGSTPAIDLRLTFEIDENSLATQVATSGKSFGSLASCAAGVMSQIRTQEAPDVGTVQVAVVIRFLPS